MRPGSHLVCQREHADACKGDAARYSTPFARVVASRHHHWFPLVEALRYLHHTRPTYQARGRTKRDRRGGVSVPSRKGCNGFEEHQSYTMDDGGKGDCAWRQNDKETHEHRSTPAVWTGSLRSLTWAVSSACSRGPRKQ